MGAGVAGGAEVVAVVVAGASVVLAGDVEVVLSDTVVDTTVDAAELELVLLHAVSDVSASPATSAEMMVVRCMPVMSPPAGDPCTNRETGRPTGSGGIPEGMSGPATNSHERIVQVAPEVGLRTLGRGLDGDRTPFLLVHGLASNARMWDGVAEVLAAAGHPAVAVDQRGHGRSSKPDHGYDFTTVVGDLVALVGELGWQRPIVVGQSWGGNVVVELAATHPDLVAGVVAVDGGFIELAERFDTWDECRSMLAPPHLVGTPAASMEKWIRNAHDGWPESGVIGAMANFEVRADGTIAPWLTFDRHMMILEALYHHRPSRRFGAITAPVLLVPADTGNVAWTHDKQVAVDEALARLANGRAHWFSPAHHDVHAQHPVELANVLIDFAEEALHR